MGASDPAVVEGYAVPLSAEPGSTVGLHLSVTRPGLLGDVVPGDRACHAWVQVARVGTRREPLWRADDVMVEARAIPGDAAAGGARWPATLHIEIPETWQPGFYEVEIRSRPEGEERVAHAGFVVRAPTGQPRAPILLVLATNTWNAYNDWGGPNLYTGGTHVSFARPFARGLVSRPDPAVHRNANLAPEPDPEVERWTDYVLGEQVCAWSGCAGWPSWEALFVAWAERHGYGIDYAVNADLAERPELLEGYPLVLSVGHDEYWSWEMRDVIDAHLARGANVAFLSGNTCFWQVRLEDVGTTMVAYKARARDEDPVAGTGQEHRLTSLWADPRVGRPEAAMTGVSFTRGGYARIGAGAPRGAGGYTVWRPEHWLFEGTGLHYGDLLGADHAVVGYECDGCVLSLRDGLPEPTGEDGCPAGFEVLATAPAHLWSKDADHDEYPSGLSALRPIGELQEIAEIVLGDRGPDNVARLAHGRAVLGVHRPGGTVVTTGCTDWTFGLVGRDPIVERITRNVLGRLSAPGG